MTVGQDKIGDYTLLEALEGHDREIHRARDASGVRAIVAMFELTDEAAEGLREDFERTKALDHEAIATAVDLFETDGKLAVVFEGIAGVSASQVLDYLDERWEQLSDGAALKIGLSLCEALHAAHTAKDAEGRVAPLVHAQLSPHQIFLTFDGKVQLLGLGLGTAFRTAAGRDDIPDEALPYQAPEVVRGGPLTVRANVFSAGALLWRLLSRKPLPGRHQPFPSLSEVRSDLPKDLTKAIDAALEPSMLKRRTTCVQLARAIERSGLADGKDLSWNLELLSEDDGFADSTLGLLSFPPAHLSDAPPASIQPLSSDLPVSSDFPGPDSDAPTNVVAVPPLGVPSFDADEDRVEAPRASEEALPSTTPRPRDGTSDEAATTAASSQHTDPPKTPLSPQAPGFLDVVPMPTETAAMAEVPGLRWKTRLASVGSLASSLSMRSTTAL